MAGQAVSSFVDGFFRGRDWRDAKEDRRLNRERQTRLDGMDAEAHNARMREYDVRLQDANLSLAEKQRLIDLRNQATAEWQRLNSETPGMGLPQAPGMPADPASMPSSGAGPSVMTQPPAMGVQEEPAVMLQRPVPVTTTELGVSQNVQPGVASNSQGGQAVPARPMPRNPDLALNGPGAGGGMRDLYEIGALPRRYQEGIAAGPNSPAAPQESPSSPNLDRARSVQSGVGGFIGDVGAAGIDAVTDAAALAMRGGSNILNYGVGVPLSAVSPELGAAVMDSADRIYNKADELALTGQREQGQPAQAPAPEASQIAPNTPPAEVAPQAVRDAEQTAATAPASQEGAAASVAVAAEVAEALGLRPNESVTPAQIDRAGAAYEQQYRADVVPRMVDFYMRNGMFEEANAFIEVVESVNGQMAMRELGKATFAATIGDFDGAANGMLSAFKAYGIVDPGMTIDEEKTGVTKDERGRPIGGKIVMVDPRTGNTFEQSFDSIDEFMTYGHMMLQPQTIAETLLERRANTQEMGTVSDMEKLILQEATKLVEASSEFGQTPISMEQAIQQVTQSLNAVRGGASLGELGASQGQPMRIPTSPEGITRF